MKKAFIDARKFDRRKKDCGVKIDIVKMSEDEVEKIETFSIKNTADIEKRRAEKEAEREKQRVRDEFVDRLLAEAAKNAGI